MSNKSRKQKLDVLSLSKDESRGCGDETPSQIDWTRCIFSHNVKPEKLVNPTELKRRSNCKQTLIIYRKTFENLRQKASPISQSINFVTLGRRFLKQTYCNTRNSMKCAESPSTIIIFKRPRRA